MALTYVEWSRKYARQSQHFRATGTNELRNMWTSEGNWRSEGTGVECGYL
jgi:hypothetical protein